jgi:hypothetical protein
LEKNCIATKIRKTGDDIFEEWKLMSGVFDANKGRHFKNYQKERRS